MLEYYRGAARLAVFGGVDHRATQRLLNGEIVRIDSLYVQTLHPRHPDAMIDHELCELGAIHENDGCLDRGGIGTGFGTI